MTTMEEMAAQSAQLTGDGAQPPAGAPPADPTDGVKRFGGRNKPIPFMIDDDMFYAAAKIPADMMVELVDKSLELKEGQETGGGTKMFSLALDMFEMVLLDDSFALIKSRMGDKKNPVDLKDVIDVMQWLIGEAYGLRPTKQPSFSGDTFREVDGTSSTDGQPEEESTPSDSPGTDASTSSTSGSSTS